MAKDRYHDVVKNALIKDGWTITHDPYRIESTIDRLLAAEKGVDHIAVDVEGFWDASDIADFEWALGRYVLYRALMNSSDPKRQLRLAVPQSALTTTFQRQTVGIAVENVGLPLVAFDPERQEVTQWIR